MLTLSSVIFDHLDQSPAYRWPAIEACEFSLSLAEKEKPGDMARRARIQLRRIRLDYQASALLVGVKRGFPFQIGRSKDLKAGDSQLGATVVVAAYMAMIDWRSKDD